ncbi:MAG TPA: OstA-like protein [Ignavibacteriaceae bacterium]|nr:OstA-like protein [Ignavibacteriaceae bacterium]
MNKIFYIFSLMILFSVNIFSQEKEEIITVVGDSLVGRIVSGETTREVYGHVVLTQGNVIITCNKAIQYISRNDAELIGDVVLNQDSMTIKTPSGFYYGNERRAESSSGVQLDDKKVILTADSGEYFFNEDKAVFRSKVTLYDTASTLTSKALTYYKNENRAIAMGDVEIVQKDNIIDADTLEHFRDSRVTFANSNVRIRNKSNNVQIFGDHLIDDAIGFHSVVDKNPLLLQIDTTRSRLPDSLITYSDSIRIKLDTLIIKSGTMEAYRDTINTFKAEDSVKIWRDSFASLNDYSIYLKNDEKIITYRKKEGDRKPVLWNETTQLTGDSVTIFLKKNEIQALEVNRKAFVLSPDENYPQRYNQISGDKLIMYFDSSTVSRVDVNGNVYNVYYMYNDEQKPNGLTQSSAESAAITFKNKKVDQVRLYGSPKSEYYPENMVGGKELNYALPGFNIVENRPEKSLLIRTIKPVERIYSPIDTLQ